MIARVRQYRSAEEAIKEWITLGLEMPGRALELVPGLNAVFVEGETTELAALLREAVADNIPAAISDQRHRPRLCLVGDDEEVEALDAVMGGELISNTIERYRSNDSPSIPMPRGELLFDRPLVMGILNVTPDSFSDGGKNVTTDDAVNAGLRMVDDGADIIDVGGESTRPGAQAVPLDEELRRVVPVIRELSRQVDAPISVDTRKPEVAQAAIEAGASIINDVSGLEHPEMSRVAAKNNMPVILMHSLADPSTMQKAVNETTYDDVVSDIIWWWEKRMAAARKVGLHRSQIILDPGIGFGKLQQHNLDIIARTREFRCSGRPILIGASRKGFLGKITGERPDQRLGGSLAAAAIAVMGGASIVRVHDVKETAELVKTIQAIRSIRT
jgi:dihydropteroate synthase